MKKHVFYLLSLLFVNLNFGQEVSPQYTFNTEGKVNFMKFTDAGVLVVASSGGLIGIKGGESQPHFHFKDYGKVKEEELEFIPFSPYVILSDGGMFSSKKTVIDLISGKKLFSTEENGWKTSMSCHVFLPQNKLVISGMRGMKEKNANKLGVYDLNTGKEENLFEMRGFSLVTGKPFLKNDLLIIPTSKELIAISIVNGEQKWTAKVDDIKWMTANDSGTDIYAFESTNGGSTKIYKLNNTGQVIWKNPAKVKGHVSNFQITPTGLAVVSDVDNSGKSGLAKLASAASESRIAFLSASNGEDLWEKAPKTKGYVQHFYVMDDGILFGIQEGGINKISFDGTTLFKKPLKTGENIHTMALTNKGMIYITDSDANIVDLKTGESVYKKPISYKKAKAVCSTYDEKNKRYLISTGEELLAIEENSGELSTLSTYKFEEKEAPTSMAIRNGGILLSSSQNLMMLNFDGSKKFHEYYRSPGKSAFGAILAGALAVTSTVIASSAAVEAGMNRNTIGQYNQRGAQAKIIQDGFSDIASASFKELNKRFKATSSTENNQFVLTKLDSGVGLVRINKDSGKKDKEVLLKDKDPSYEIDEIMGYLFYNKDKNIQVFNLN
jgi:hypothetical protein